VACCGKAWFTTADAWPDWPLPPADMLSLDVPTALPAKTATTISSSQMPMARQGCSALQLPSLPVRLVRVLMMGLLRSA